jgi:hypothetical protein
MAGNNDADGIFSVCRADGSRCFRTTEAPGLLSIGDVLSVRNFQKLTPNLSLEFRSHGCERDVEDESLATEVFRELSFRFVEDHVAAFD